MIRFTGLILVLASGLPSLTMAAESVVEVDERIGGRLPLDLEFQDESGETVKLSRYVDGTGPVVLTLVYYNCPLLCNLLLNGFVAGLTQGTGIPAGDLDIVTISIDP